MKTLISGTIAIMLAMTIAACTSEPLNNETAPLVHMTAADTLLRGKYLVTTMGCNDCHSPKQMGTNGPQIVRERMLSGYPADRPLPPIDRKNAANGWIMFVPDLTAAAGPWGVSFAANLTPDETGIGNWSYEQFRKALTEGKYKGLDNSRQLLPPMPWENFRNIRDEDLKAIFAYLKSIPPVKNAVPAAELSKR